MDTLITGYRTVSAAHPHDLDEKIMVFLAEGWQLYGSPYSQPRAGYDALVCQALVSTGLVNPEG